ncbi:MAG: PQQ-binding-like beta-propeller repeat protein, partial [Planctomycetes bacterium]|nr:PQQ-binding-like beta-propeller repeat protein [Planctomycetota bacterium]
MAESGIRGGLIVLVGCRDAGLAVSLARSPHVLVHLLVQDRDRLDPVRTEIRDAGLYGRVSAMPWESGLLPYADGMVNLLLVPEDGVALDPEEIDRVLAPMGTARIQREGVVTTYTKPWPADVDQWTHSRYDATGNAVSKDKRVGPPRFLQWEATPRWNRGVKTSCLVSARGRLFYILDDSHFASGSPTWSVIARDAANGIRLWRHELAGWEGARGGKKVGPAQVHRRLVASDDRVFVTLGESAPVSVLDAATGEILRTLENTEPAEEFLLSQGTLVVLVNPNTAADLRRGRGQDMRVVAVDPVTGKLLWAHSTPMVMPLTLAADGKQVVYHDGGAIVSLDLKTGAPRWASPPTGQTIVYRDQANPDSPGAEKSTIVLAPQFAPTLIIYEDVVAFAGGRQLNVVSASDGHELWRSEYAPSNYSVPVDLFGFAGCLWGPDEAMNLWRPLDDDLDFNAYDPQTGTIEKSVTGKYGFRFQHHRCHQMKVVDHTVIAARAGIEFLDCETGKVTANHWTRGSCFFGVLPANGHLYLPPHNCACYVRAKLSGFMALNSDPPLRSVQIPEDRKLQRGPAYGCTAESDVGADGPASVQIAGDRTEDWPTYRHDMARSGRTGTRVSSELLLGWQRTLGGRLTSPVIARHRLFLASTDAHTLNALDAVTGEPLWQYTFDGSVDSPP